MFYFLTIFIGQRRMLMPVVMLATVALYSAISAAEDLGSAIMLAKLSSAICLSYTR